MIYCYPAKILVQVKKLWNIEQIIKPLCFCIHFPATMHQHY